MKTKIGANVPRVTSVPMLRWTAVCMSSHDVVTSMLVCVVCWQPLLDVDHTSARLNLLTPRYVNQKGVALPTSSAVTRRAKRENLQQKQILVPELCDVHPFPASLWRKAVCLPAMLYRVNCLLIAEQLRHCIAVEAHIGSADGKLTETDSCPALRFGCCDISQTKQEEVLAADPGDQLSTAECEPADALLQTLQEIDINKDSAEGAAAMWSSGNCDECVNCCENLSDDRCCCHCINAVCRNSGATSYTGTCNCSQLVNSKCAERGSAASTNVNGLVSSACSNCAGSECCCSGVDKIVLDAGTSVGGCSGVGVLEECDEVTLQCCSFSLDADTSSSGGPSPCDVIQALTMSNANDFFNLERLETIGDSFLKFAISIYLYCMYPGIHEGKLSYLRSIQVDHCFVMSHTYKISCR